MKRNLTTLMLLYAAIFLFSCKTKEKNGTGSEKEGTKTGKETTTVEKGSEENETTNRGKTRSGGGSGGFTASTPAGWERQETTMGGMKVVYFMSPQEDENDRFRENINIVTEKTGSASLQEYVDRQLIEMEKSMPGFTELESSSIKFAGLQGRTVLYQHTMTGSPVDVKMFVAIENGTAYIISCSAPEGRIDDLKKPIDEFIENFSIN